MKQSLAVTLLWLSLCATPGADRTMQGRTAWLNPVPPGLVTCSNLTLKLDGQPVWVEHLAKECPADAPDWFRRGASSNLVVAIASFPCPSPGILSLHLDQPAASVIVRPKSLRVPVSGGGRDWKLSLPGPCKLYVEIGSLPPLMVFAEAPETAPAPDPARTRIFGPGIHEPGIITLQDDDQVYVAPGAIVYGGLRGGPKNARVFGRGILDGSRLNDSMVQLNGASNVVVEGIITRCGKFWQNTLTDCDQITYRNVKVLSFTPSGDGINPVGCRNVLIEDCFFRCSDDCVAVKAPGKGPRVSDITVRNCTMAGYAFSDGFTIGYETVTPIMENITVRNCDILYARGGTRAGQHSAFSIICDGPATVRNVTFEDIRVEENVTRLFELNVTDGQFYTRTAPGRIHNVRLKNVQWETSWPILITGHHAAHLVEGIAFEGCRVAGQPLDAKHIQTNAFVQRLEIR